MHQSSIFVLQNKSPIIIFLILIVILKLYFVCKTKAVYLTIKDTEIKFDVKWANGIYNLKHLYFIYLKVLKQYILNPHCVKIKTKLYIITLFIIMH
jgi:hypothetical protein